jgi:hypothetical protein
MRAAKIPAAIDQTIEAVVNAVAAERIRCAAIARFAEKNCTNELTAKTARAIAEAIENDAIG